MQPVKSALTQASYKPLSTIKPVNAREYDNFENPNRRWEVAYGYTKEGKKYLTDQEREYFLGEMAKGKTIVQVGLLTLTNKFLYIAPIRDKHKKTEYELIEVNGQQVYREV